MDQCSICKHTKEVHEYTFPMNDLILQSITNKTLLICDDCAKRISRRIVNAIYEIQDENGIDKNDNFVLFL